MPPWTSRLDANPVCQSTEAADGQAWTNHCIPMLVVESITCRATSRVVEKQRISLDVSISWWLFECATKPGVIACNPPSSPVFCGGSQQPKFYMFLLFSFLLGAKSWTKGGETSVASGDGAEKSLSPSIVEANLKAALNEAVIARSKAEADSVEVRQSVCTVIFLRRQNPNGTVPRLSHYAIFPSL